jgi:hypothetical protein
VHLGQVGEERDREHSPVWKRKTANDSVSRA